RARLTTSLHLGAPLQVSAVVLGTWPRGDTLTVHADGRTDGDRLAVLDVATAVELLSVLREAHTGEAGPVTPPTGADMSPSPAGTPGEPDPTAAGPASPANPPDRPTGPAPTGADVSPSSAPRPPVPTRPV